MGPDQRRHTRALEFSPSTRRQPAAHYGVRARGARERWEGLVRLGARCRRPVDGDRRIFGDHGYRTGPTFTALPEAQIHSGLLVLHIPGHLRGHIGPAV